MAKHLGLDLTSNDNLGAKAGLEAVESVTLLLEVVVGFFDLAANLGSVASIDDVTLGTMMVTTLTTADLGAGAGARAGGGRRARAAGGGGDLAEATRAAGAGVGRRGAGGGGRRAGVTTMTARVLLAATTVKALQSLSEALDGLAEVDNGVAVLLEEAGHLLSALVMGKTSGDVDHEGMASGGGLDTNGRNLDGTEELLLVHVLDGDEVIGEDDDIIASNYSFAEDLGVLLGLEVEGVEEVSTVDDGTSVDTLKLEEVKDAAKLDTEGLLDHEADVTLGAAAGDNLDIRVGGGAAGRGRSGLGAGGALADGVVLIAITAGGRARAGTAGATAGGCRATAATAAAGGGG